MKLEGIRGSPVYYSLCMKVKSMHLPSPGVYLTTVHCSFSFSNAHFLVDLGLCQEYSCLCNFHLLFPLPGMPSLQCARSLPPSPLGLCSDVVLSVCELCNFVLLPDSSWFTSVKTDRHTIEIMAKYWPVQGPLKCFCFRACDDL